MKVKSHVLHGLLRAIRISVLSLGGLLLASTALAQDDSDIEKLEAQLEQQRVALQEAIADREATAFRTKAVKEMLAESEETKKQIEEEVKMLCEEQEELKPGTLEDCMSSSSN